MRRTLLAVVVLAGLLLGSTQPAAAAPSAAATSQQRYIVRTTGGLLSILRLCQTLNCQVQGALDGSIGQTYLVTSSGGLVSNLLNTTQNLLAALLGIKSIEPDSLLSMPAVPQANPAPGLSDTAPVNYYGSIVWHGYAAQPAALIVRLPDAQGSFRVTGSGVIVADIDTGVDVNHPVLIPVLLQGYDFTRNQPGASEWLDVTGLPNGPSNNGSQNAQPAFVQQSTAAVLDQSTAAVLDSGPYEAFGHGTMTAGMIHLVAPQAQILPLKAFSSNGTGYLSNIIAALYYATQNHANVVNMSFDLTSASPALSAAVSYANNAGLVLVASAGNEDTNAPVYPAALNGNVMGIASTTDWDARSSFSNYGSVDVWVAAPGENIISTYPGGLFASESGTSFSSPMVAGAAALLFDAKANLNQSKAASAIAHARTLTPDLNNGRLDLYQAVLAWLSAR
jgi:subtilisin family serine protease